MNKSNENLLHPFLYISSHASSVSSVSLFRRHCGSDASGSALRGEGYMVLRGLVWFQRYLVYLVRYLPTRETKTRFELLILVTRPVYREVYSAYRGLCVCPLRCATCRRRCTYILIHHKPYITAKQSKHRTVSTSYK